MTTKMAKYRLHLAEARPQGGIQPFISFGMVRLTILDTLLVSCMDQMLI